MNFWAALANTHTTTHTHKHTHTARHKLHLCVVAKTNCEISSAAAEAVEPSQQVPLPLLTKARDTNRQQLQQQQLQQQLQQQQLQPTITVKITFNILPFHNVFSHQNTQTFKIAF